MAKKEMQCPICKEITELEAGVEYSKWPCAYCGGWFDFSEGLQAKETTVRGDAKKFDHGKTMWDLLPYDQIEKVAEVMTHGAGKYGAESWKKVDKARYEAAFMRHYVAWKKGNLLDKDSGLTHLSHAACNMLFLMWLEEHKDGS